MQKPIDKIIDFFYPYKKYQSEKARDFNRESLKEAAKRVKRGGLVILFTERNGNSWRLGIGHLIKEIGSVKDVFLVPAYISGTSHFDFARVIPGFGKFMPRVCVTFAHPVMIKNFVDSDPKKIASDLEQNYRNLFHKPGYAL